MDIPVNDPFVNVGFISNPTRISRLAAAVIVPVTICPLANAEEAVTAELNVLAKGQMVTGTITAAANLDILVGLDINPTFTNGSFTGISNYATKITGNLKLDAGINDSYGATGNIILDNARGLKTKDNSGVVRDMFKLFSDNIFMIDNVVGSMNFRTGGSYITRLYLDNTSGFVGILNSAPLST